MSKLYGQMKFMYGPFGVRNQTGTKLMGWTVLHILYCFTDAVMLE